MEGVGVPTQRNIPHSTFSLLIQFGNLVPKRLEPTPAPGAKRKRVPSKIL